MLSSTVPPAFLFAILLSLLIIHHIRFRALLYSHDRMFGVSAARYRLYLMCFDLVSTPVQRCPSRPTSITRAVQLIRFVFHQNLCRPYTNDMPQARFGSPCSCIGPHTDSPPPSLSLFLFCFEFEVSNFRLNLRQIFVRPSVVQPKHRPNSVMSKSFLKIRERILIFA